MDSISPVSIHAPAWGATDDCLPFPIHYYSFNSRARMGRDLCFMADPYCAAVSIHAPAWGATALRTRLSGVSVSIHAPAWGATSAPVTLPDIVPVSIHAPAWGATRFMAILSTS